MRRIIIYNPEYKTEKQVNKWILGGCEVYPYLHINSLDNVSDETKAGVVDMFEDGKGLHDTSFSASSEVPLTELLSELVAMHGAVETELPLPEGF